MKEKPSRAILQTIRLLEQEIDGLEQRRSELLRVIDSLRPLAGEAPQTGGRQKPASRRNDLTAKGEAIVAALRAKSPQSPGALAKALKLRPPTLAYQMKPLLKIGAVVATGKTADRQFSLPPRSRAAKEAP